LMPSSLKPHLAAVGELKRLAILHRCDGPRKRRQAMRRAALRRQDNLGKNY
jgi:hypothetical protein